MRLARLHRCQSNIILGSKKMSIWTTAGRRFSEQGTSEAHDQTWVLSCETHKWIMEMQT